MQGPVVVIGNRRRRSGARRSGTGHGGLSLLRAGRGSSFSPCGRRNTDGRRAFRRAVGGLGGAPGRRPECDVCYRFDADRRSARTGFHELGAGAGLIGYPRRPRRAGACLRQASRNGPRNPRDPGRNLSDGRVERPVTRLRRLLVLMPGLPPFGLLEAAKAASARWVASRASAPAFARIAALRILDRPACSARRAAGLPPSTGRRDGRRAVRQEPRSIRSRRPQGRRPHEPSMRRNEGRVGWRRGRAGGKGMAERERREIAAVRAGR